MLLVRTCQMYPNAVAATLMQKFFIEASYWDWPTPILLKEVSGTINLGFPVWNPIDNTTDANHLMPIITPTYPQQNSTHNVSKATKKIINKELIEGFKIINEIMLEGKDWEMLFKPSKFFLNYRHFVMIMAKSDNAEDQLKWTGLIESKIRVLISSVDQNELVATVHLNPQRFENPNAEFTTMWFFGLEFKQASNLNVNLTDSIQNFIDLVQKQSYYIYKTGMTVEAKHVKRSQLSEFIDASHLDRKRSINKVQETRISSTARQYSLQSRKRMISESSDASSSSSENQIKRARNV